MVRIIKISIIFILCSLCSCSLQKKKVTVPPLLHSQQGKEEHLLNRLQYQFNLWKGTPYRQGGNGRKGIDCSALVQTVYYNEFKIHLPRTTREQVKFGRSVKPNSLRAGDLLFFKTGWRNNHVGIYLDNGKFFHASTSKGVTISRITSPHWQKYFYSAKRLTLR